MTEYSQSWRQLKKHKQKVKKIVRGFRPETPMLDSLLVKEAEHTEGGISAIINKALKKFLGVKA